MRKHLNHRGKPKIGHRTKGAAWKHIGLLKKANKRKAKGLEPYECSVCGKWHIGHKN